MAWLTDTEAKAAVAAALHSAGYTALAADGAFWAQTIPKALTTAKYDILEILVGRRGYTAAQVDTWDMQADVRRQQIIYWSLVEGQGVQGLDPTLVSLVDKLDRRLWLETAALLVADGPIEPESETVSLIGHGPLKTTDDLFGNKAW